MNQASTRSRTGPKLLSHSRGPCSKVFLLSAATLLLSVSGCGSLEQSQNSPAGPVASSAPGATAPQSALMRAVSKIAKTTMVSVQFVGVQANAQTYHSSLSADGRYVAFVSDASNLVPGDTNGISDVFVRDRQTGTTTRVSLDSTGAQANGTSYHTSISADGRYVAFVSAASNLVTGDNNGTYDVFVRDRQTNSTSRVSLSSAGLEGNNLCDTRPSISADGRYVAFASLASNLVAGDTNGTWDVFVRDRQTNTTSRVSLSSAGLESDGPAYYTSLSNDGRYLAFASSATNLVAGDTNSAWDVFVRDLQTGATTRVSTDSSGNQADGASDTPPSLSGDGRYLTFASSATNLVGVGADTNGYQDIFLRDLQAGITSRVSLDSSGAEANADSTYPALSGDGRSVAFYSSASNLVAADTNAREDVFVRDLQAGTTTRVSLDSTGAQANNPSPSTAVSPPALSNDGRSVAFVSYASNLVAGDTNNTRDVFVRDRQTSSTTRVNVDSSPSVPGNSASYTSPSSMSGDGRYVAFCSYASNLVAGDTNNSADIFVSDRLTGAITRVSVDSGGAQANLDSDQRVSISGNGRYVAFASAANNLVSGDTNSAYDVFVRDLQTGTTTRVSLTSGGAQANLYGGSYGPSISADGRYVAFYSDATNLVGGDTNVSSDVFVRDLQTGTTTRVSLDSTGAQALNGGSYIPSISADGRYVAFYSSATNLVTGDTNSNYDVFVRDLQTGTTTRVSLDSGGAQADYSSYHPSISADGRYVAFVSDATNLVTGDTNNTNDVFVRDCQTGTTTRVSVDSSGAQANSSGSYPSISGDGRYVAFHSVASNLVTGDTNNTNDVFVRDRQTGTTTRLSVDSSGLQANNGSYYPSISGDGRYVGFSSNASNLFPGDSNGQYDVFVRDNPL